MWAKSAGSDYGRHQALSCGFKPNAPICTGGDTALRQMGYTRGGECTLQDDINFPLTR